MKTHLRIPILSALCLALSMAHGAELKMGTVDMVKVFNGYWKSKKAQEALRQKEVTKEGQQKELMEEQQKLVEQHQKMMRQLEDPTLNVAEKERLKRITIKKADEVRELMASIDQFRRASITELQKDEGDARKKLLDEIREVISAKAKERSYNYIFDAAAMGPAGNPALLFSEAGHDLTTEILTQLNASDPDKTSPAPKPKTTPEPPKGKGK
ncbi:MAG: OmpH family outer membrane protein [Pedosphaera sp.]|nr:OmpH family outer membrane protein [Pedosphaera sp.]MSU43910.1 OmpH family outer membrane protein [Pedosphaera sp.]